MLKQVAKKIEKIKNLTSSPRASFDASTFNDPIAMQTSWSPVERGGDNLTTHKLVSTSSNRLEFRATIRIKVFYLCFLLVGIGGFIGSFKYMSSIDFSFNMMSIVFLIIAFFITYLGGTLLYRATAPVIFDKRRGAFWKGRKAPDEVSNKGSLKCFTKLDQIHALQLISEHCQSNDRSYTSYELNIILKNSERINVIDHGNQRKLRNDASTLASFLEKPLWDAV